MTGTSLDGLDAALACVEGTGLDLRARQARSLHHPLPAGLRKTLSFLTSGQAAQPSVYLQTARQLGQLHADAIVKLCQQQRDANPNFAPDLIVVHGQTIWHAPSDGLSWQLMDPWPIVRRLGIPVLYDLRQADLIASGHGAPITALSDWVLLRNPSRDRVIVNLGGVCNITELPAGCLPDQIRAYDVGPCNLLIDGLVRRFWPGRDYDDRGSLAIKGQSDSSFRAMIRQTHPFYDRPLPRTTGREDWSGSWLDRMVNESRLAQSPYDLLASGVDAVACDIADCVDTMNTSATTTTSHSLQVVLAGGAVKNATLVGRIRHRCGPKRQVIVSDEVGVPATGREALGMAVLGALSQDKIAVTLPGVTGAANPGRAGVWAYP